VAELLENQPEKLQKKEIQVQRNLEPVKAMKKRAMKLSGILQAQEPELL